MAGTTGEASTLTDDEKVALYRLAVREVGDRASVVAGTGQQRHGPLGAPHARGGRGRGRRRPGGHARTTTARRGPASSAHVAAIAEVGVPVILYNIPGRSGVNMEPDLIAELATRSPTWSPSSRPTRTSTECREVARTSDLADLRGQRRHAVPGARDGRRRGDLGRLPSGGRGDGRDRRGRGARGDLDEARRRDAALRRPLRRPLRHHQPHPHQGRARDDRPDPVGRGCAFPWSTRRPCSATSCAACSSARASCSRA